MELKRDRAWKDEQLKYAFSQIEAEDAEILGLNRANLYVEVPFSYNIFFFVKLSLVVHIVQC